MAVTRIPKLLKTAVCHLPHLLLYKECLKINIYLPAAVRPFKSRPMKLKHQLKYLGATISFRVSPGMSVELHGADQVLNVTLSKGSVEQL